MDVTELEEEISHFPSVTFPLRRFSAGCFSSCKFRINRIALIKVENN
jgi:hypothetical protein